MFKKFFFILLGFTSLVGASDFSSPHDKEEALFIRRIADCWKDKEYSLVKIQIEEFLFLFPQSEFKDHLYNMLGDIALIEKKYDEAIQLYAQINSLDLINDTRPKRWRALYQQQLFSQLRNEISNFLNSPFFLFEEVQFYYAEACFREALLIYETNQKEALSLCEEASPHYHALLNSSLKKHAKLALAEICHLKGHFKEAASLYMEIAESCDSNAPFQEDILFHAAQSLCYFDKVKAAALFEKLSKEGTKKKKETTAQWFQLLVRAEEWDRLAQEKMTFLSQLSSNHLALYYFYIGRASFEKREFTNCIDNLVLSLDYLPESHMKSALFLLMKSSHASENLTTFEKAYHHFKGLYGKSAPEMLQLSIARACMHAHKGNLEKAFSILNKFDENEDAQLEKVHLLCENHQYNEAHSECLRFLSKHPNSRNIIHSIIEVSLKALEKEPQKDHLDALALDLNRALHSDVFDLKEKENYHFLLAKSYYFLEDFSSCRALLEEHFISFEPTAEAHFLMAMCDWKMQTEFPEMIMHGEEALRLNPHCPDASKLRLALFNAYLSASKSTSEEEIHKAADHLFLASEREAISLENRLWLFHHYSKYAQRYLNEKDANKATQLAELLLENKENWLQFELEAIELASLYGMLGDDAKEWSILNTLHSLQTSHAHLLWKYFDKAQLGIANVYFKQRKFNEALCLYEKLENSPLEAISSESCLQIARAKIQMLSENEKLETSLLVSEIMQRLSSLQLHKNLMQEPLHLEAALEHAEFYAALADSEEKESIYLQLLLKIKEDFASQTDIWSKDYHASRELFPDKDRIYQSYMRYIDAKIYFLQACLAKKEGNVLEGKTKESAAKALFSTLRHGKFAASKYLIKKATEGMGYAI